MARKRKNAGRMYRASTDYKGTAKKRGSGRKAVVDYITSNVRVGATKGGFTYHGPQMMDTPQGKREVFVIETPNGNLKTYYTERNAFARFNRI